MAKVMPKPTPTSRPAPTTTPKATPKVVPKAVPKATAASPGSPSGTAPAVSRVQSFTMVRIQRSQIVNAPYNPRRISEPARKRLRKSLDTHGLVEPFVWNVRTSHLVGGHQRLSLVDSIEGSKSYALDVAQIDVDPSRERALNILLNNVHAQGAFDPDLMLEFLESPETPPLVDLGFTRGELELEIGALPELDRLFPDTVAKRPPAPVAEMRDIDAIKEHARDTRQAERDGARAGHAAVSADATDRPSASPDSDPTAFYGAKRAGHRDRTDQSREWDTGYILPIAFSSTEEKEAFLDHVGLPIDLGTLDPPLLKELLKPEYANYPVAEPDSPGDTGDTGDTDSAQE